MHLSASKGAQRLAEYCCSRSQDAAACTLSMPCQQAAAVIRAESKAADRTSVWVKTAACLLALLGCKVG